MATVTDTLETVLRLVELNTFLRGFELIAGAVERAVETYSNFDASIQRAQFLLQQFGHSLPAGELTDFARQLSLTTGASQGAIAGLEAYLARFRGTGTDIEHTTQVILEASQATGLSLERIGHGVEAAVAGHGRMFWKELGIQIKGVEGQLLSLNQVTSILEAHFGGFAARFGESLPGALLKASAAVEDLVIQFGRLFSPAFLALVQIFTSVVETLAETFHNLADSLGIATPGLEGAGAALATSGGGTLNRTEQYLEQIAFNTGPQGPLVRVVGHGGGSFAEPGGGVPIRDFNLQFRSVR